MKLTPTPEIPTDLFKLIVDQSLNAVAMFDLEMRYLYVNERWIKDNGWNGPEFIGQLHYDVVPCIPDRWKEIHRACLSGSIESSEEDRLDLNDGSSLWIRWHIRPWKTEAGKIGGILMCTEDITQKKTAEDELKKANEELERRVEVRTGELARSNIELEQFAYVTSHDLQEPLRVLTLYAELLGRHYEGKLDESGRSYIAFMVESARRMQRLISDLLTYSRAGHISDAVEEIDLNEVLQSILKTLEYTICENSAAITFNSLPTIQGNRLLIQLLFQNLIGNALKFRNKKSHPKVQINCKKERGEWTFSIEDNGIGIDQRFSEKIFHMFQRLHKQSDYPGTGIGLAICKKIVELHEGKIWMKSQVGDGTTFYFTLPQRKQRALKLAAAV